MLKIALTVKRDDSKAHEVAGDFVRLCHARQITVQLSADSVAEAPFSLEQQVDIEVAPLTQLAAASAVVVVIGGDGTFLQTARHLYGSDTPLIGVNLGRLGFLTEVAPDQIATLLDDLQANRLSRESRAYFTATVVRDGKEVWQDTFLNDAVLQRYADEKMIAFGVAVAGQSMVETRGDGMIVASPTGSTAYNLSTGGPILYPSLDALVLSPICAHKLSLRPVVAPGDNVSMTLHSDVGNLSIDGRSVQKLQAGDVVTVRRSPHTLNLLHEPGRNFFDLLRQKFSWG